MGEPGLSDGVSILNVLAVGPCAQAIFEYVPVRDLVRSERVSKDWQQAVYNHLQYPRKCKLYSGLHTKVPLPGHDCPHYIIDIENDGNSWSVLSKTVEKLGAYIVSLNTNCGEPEHLRIIGSNCPHLKKILIYDLKFLQTSNSRDVKKFISKNNVLECFSALKQIKIVNSRYTDQLLSQPSQIIEYENIEISGSRTTGRFLEHIQLNALKTLSIADTNCLNIRNIECMAHKMQNLTELHLNKNNTSVLQNVHKALTKLPKLETLSLCGYTCLLSKKNLLESITQLGNLKRLILAGNFNVDDEWLKVIGRDCKNLKYLDITDFAVIGRRLTAAVCRRPPPVNTIVCVSSLGNFTSDEIEHFFKRLTYIGEKQALGDIEVTEQWLEAAASAYSIDYIEVQLRQACRPVADGPPLQVPLHELKI